MMKNNNQIVKAESGELVTTSAFGELQTAHSQAMAVAEIQSVITIAKQFKRNEDECFQDLMRTCKRFAFADLCEYKFPRGWKMNDETGAWEKNYVSGKSVYLAREAARLWTNVRYGVDVTNDMPAERKLRAWAWDIEKNNYVSQDVVFEKVIQRKKKNSNETEWVVPDQRDLRELTNKMGAMAVRNCILQILPVDYTDLALEQAQATVAAKAKESPDEFRQKIIMGFDEINVTVGMLEELLGHPLAQCSPSELSELRSIWKSIYDGNSVWSDYLREAAQAEQPKTVAVNGTADKSDAKLDAFTKSNGNPQQPVQPSGRQEPAQTEQPLNGNTNQKSPASSQDFIEGLGIPGVFSGSELRSKA
jgi:hypothetical protein